MSFLSSCKSADLLIALDEQIDEVKREIAQRQQDYSRGVTNRRLAARRVDVMLAVLATLEKARGGE